MTVPQALVIDDNPINLELITLLLESEGFEVIATKDAAEALRIIETRVPELFVLDVQLPGMSGLDLLRLLRSRPDTVSACAVVVTSYAMEADRAVAQAAGCDSYFSKPIDTRRFGEDVRKVYEHSRHRATSESS